MRVRTEAEMSRLSRIFVFGGSTSDKEDPDKIGEVAEDTQLYGQSQEQTCLLVD